ncbi:MAG: ATP-binding cassette domain-containing protein [Spirochaetes bacterium]|jgi:ABC-2 type transport system ATP-binding protein|nr:ATP-binding cassette domain-containing protein [Spirochaetota bacterium]
MIRVTDVRKSYGHVEAVRGVSFEVSRREVFGLLGPNGAGKTTILRMLTGYHFPTSGTATVNGYDVYAEPITVKRNIGYLPESAPLYSELNVMEYLQFIAQARGIPPSKRAEHIDRAVQECGLEEVAYRSIDKLSKGYRQRTGLAQAIIHDPDVLILDEPTSGLDPNQIIEIRRLVRELGSTKTVILSTHILQEVEAVCDRVLILNRGRVAAEGTTAEITSGMKGEDVFLFTVKGAGEQPVRSALGNLRELRRIEHIEATGVGPAARTDVKVTLGARRGEEAGAPGGAPEGAALEGGAPEGGELIFDWAVSEGFKLVGLERKRYSLEDVFISLTTEGQPS